MINLILLISPQRRQTNIPAQRYKWDFTLMATTILRVVPRRFFILIADECVYCANNEQLVVCFCYVDDQLAVHEELLGLYMCLGITAYTIIKVLEDVLLRLNLKSSRCRGQGYDGGSKRRQSTNLSRHCWVSSALPNPMDCTQWNYFQHYDNNDVSGILGVSPRRSTRLWDKSTCEWPCQPDENL